MTLWQYDTFRRHIDFSKYDNLYRGKAKTASLVRGETGKEGAVGTESFLCPIVSPQGLNARTKKCGQFTAPHHCHPRLTEGQTNQPKEKHTSA